MAKNDPVLIDAIIEERQQQAHKSETLGELFEYFALEQVLKDFDLSRDEINAGWIDGRDDGGIDAFYIFVNGHLLQDPSDFAWPKRHAHIDVYILSCKHHDTFQQAPVNSLLASIPELLDFGLDKTGFKGTYSEPLIDARELLHTVYRQLAGSRPTLSFHFAYVSRGDSCLVGENVRARASQLVGLIDDLFSECNATFDFVGAQELVTLYRRTKSFSLGLPVLECFTSEPRSYVALTRVDEYCRFVTDEDGNLRRYLFDSNIRDYLGSNLVNQDIASTLQDADAPDFWWLNNGVTLLATNATLVGKMIQVQDVQIVNGLQTTESIFRHFESAKASSESRAILVKIIISSDPVIRDRIIRATNDQSIVEVSSLRATDKVQRDIEAILEQHEWYYERRMNDYRHIGKPTARFVTPMYLAAGIVAVVMKNPALASRLKPRFIKDDYKYARVFSDEPPAQVWVKVTETLKRVEDVLTRVRPSEVPSSRGFLAQWRNLVALLSVSRALGRFSYGLSDLSRLDAATITPELVLEMWNVVKAQLGPSGRGGARKAVFVKQCCLLAGRTYQLPGPEVVCRQNLDLPPGSQTSIPKRRKSKKKRGRKSSESFLRTVDSELPAQPWKPKVHRIVAKTLKCKSGAVYDAIQVLIKRGIRCEQKDGIVYDECGKVVDADEERFR